MKACSKSLIAVAAVLAFALAGPGVLIASQKQPAAAPAPQPQPGKSKAGSEAPTISGKVVETMNAAGYTYVCLEKNGEKTWVAAPETEVAVGQEMSFEPGQQMTNFTSKTLGRTFGTIIFSSGPVAPGAAAQQPGRVFTGKGGGSKAASSPLAKDITVEKAAGPDSYTVAEIFEKRGSLDKKTAVVKGKVVKATPNIMGRNWIHLQDGTGNQKKGSHNLVVTSQDLPSVGDVVTVKGTVYKDKDFGSGYKYKVIMEEAKVQR